MKIYVGHCRGYDYKNELYTPLRASRLNAEHEIILPHEHSDTPFNSKESMKNFDLMVAEVSYPATGLGIEMGWADAYHVPIIAIYQSGYKLSNSVKTTAQHFLEYANSEELVNGLEEIIKKIKSA
jgi:hypothetical protein